MKKLCCLVGLFIFFFVVSAAAVEDYKDPGTDEGVNAMVAIDPLGPNNLVAAFVKFVNHNGYKVNIKWTPLITCEGTKIQKGYGADFSMDAGASYEVTIWRSAACGVPDIKELKVEMEVKKADLY